MGKRILSAEVLWIMSLSFILVIQFSERFHAKAGTKCQTPPEWFPGYQARSVRKNRVSWLEGSSEESSENKLVRPATPDMQKWPGGVVKYLFDTDSSLQPPHKATMKDAMEEYQHKTCIRFEEIQKANPNDTNYVKISLWGKPSHKSSCGKASVCMQKHDQYAKFTEWCMNKQTFVHELGHTLCLIHEQYRKDRDNFVSYDNCDTKPAIASSSLSNDGIYDYASQMHYSCEGDCGFSRNINWKLCADEIPGNTGLSVMDADTINELYDCQGCHRHRWRPISVITSDDIENMYSFGHVDSEGRSIYPCRALHRGEVAVGTFTFETMGCLMPSRFNPGSENVATDQAEVLVIPGGLSSNSGDDAGEMEEPLFQYELVNVLSETKEAIVGMAVTAGNGWSLDEQQFAKSYIAFGALTWAQFEYQEGNVQPSEYEPAIEVIGSAWDWDAAASDFESVFVTAKGNITNKVNDYKILVCK